MTARELFRTDDGSHSVRVPDLQETYHSRFGAITESQHVYMDHGLRYVMDRTPGNLRIFEVGLGTGLNALLACQVSYKHQRHLKYLALEPYPLPVDFSAKLNYMEFLPGSPANWLERIHLGPWDEWFNLSPTFQLCKSRHLLQRFENPVGRFDLVFFDAFGPSKQPEIWNEALIRKVVNYMSIGGVLVTYCAQGKFRRNLERAGCEIELKSGPPGKLQMLRAIKS